MIKYCIGTNIIGKKIYVEHFVGEQKYTYNLPTIKYAQRTHKQIKSSNQKHK